MMKQVKLSNNVFESLLNWYQIDLETSIAGSDFIFNYVNLFHYKCHKIYLKRGG